jgi:multisubunit Na+/H+ antiporter MnhG subunit
MSWANGFVFATHDKIAFSIFSLILIVFSYGFYSWIKAFFRFVFMVQISIRIKILRVFYLVTAPIIARLIVSEIFALF